MSNIFLDYWEKELGILVNLEYKNILNNRFLLIVTEEKTDRYSEISVYEYDLNSFSLLGSVKIKDLYYIKFHKHFENIFFVCTEKNVAIYHIDSDNKIIKNVTIVKGHFSCVSFADFSPFNPDIMISISRKNDIKIYNLKKSLPISHIFINEPLNKIIQVRWTENELGVISEKNILIFNYLEFLPDKVNKISFGENVIDFHFYGDKNSLPLIVITKTDIKYALDQNYIKTIYNINDQYKNNFYNKKLNYLVIFLRSEVQILSICFTKVENIYSTNTSKSKILYPIFLFDELELKEGELCKFYGQDYPMINTFKFIYKASIIEKESDNKPKEKIEEFLKDILNNISDIPLLLSKNNNIKSNYIKTKKYFEYIEIEKELQKAKKRNLFDRKEFVIKNIDDINKKKDIKEKYIKILELLVNDNTYQKLINTYIQFLKDKKNKNVLKLCFNKMEEYESELKYYLNIISVDDALSLFGQRKKSQKEELILFMENLLKFKIDEITIFEDYLNGFKELFDNMIYYNMPSDSDNIELCYNAILNLLKYSLKNLGESIKEKKSENEKKNKKNEDLKIKNNKEIVENELNFLIHKTKKTKDYIQQNNPNLEKIRYLIILFVQSKDEKEFDFGYNLITSEKLTKNDIDEFKKNNEINKKYNIKNEENYKYICLNNLGLYSDDIYYSKKIYNYEYYKNKYEEKYQISLLKNFYKNILQKKCFQSIYSTLYDEDYYPFKDKKYVDKFVDRFYHFIPMKLENYNGMTDKFSMNMYIVSFLPRVSGSGCKKSELKLLREGLIINISHHEIGHDFVNNHFFMENARIPIETPRKFNLDAEGGYYIEYALYGRKLESINMQQALYLLNEKNYDKTFLEFQEGFNELKKEDLIIEGTFKEIFKDFNLDEIISSNNKNIYLPINPAKYREKIIVRSLKNDVIGRRISDKKNDEI